ncbi:aldo/keto reductase [Paenibacillus sp. BR2-3]|uniref:aldo/keto reductase n=1 Tax=Paenibacillus sp. BR2-3 TaxID=3048494 RepID=UPI003977E1B8
MKHRRLGKTDLNVSVVGVGTWQFGGEWGKDFSQEEVNEILNRAKELGINLIDTAECYGDHLSESLIGKAIEHNRKDWILATKFGHHYHGHVDRTDHWSAKQVIQQLEDSLHALRTDYIDLYQFHSGSDEVFNNDDLWTALDKQIQAGKIRHLGISLGSNDNLYQTDAAAKVNADVIQVVYNRLDRKPEAEVFNSCERQDLGVLAREPLANGFLSGKYKPGSVFGKNDWRSLKDQEQLKLVEEIERKEVPEGVDMAQWALAWCLQHSAVTCVIPGYRNVAQLESSAKAAELELF